MTDNPVQRQQDWELASLFGREFTDRARRLLREGANIEAVAEQLRLPLGAVRHWSRKVEREKREREKRKRKRPNWQALDQSLVNQARHRATAGIDAATIASEIGLPIELCSYIVRRAGVHARRRERAASAQIAAP